MGVQKVTLAALWRMDSGRSKSESREKVRRAVKSFGQEIIMTWPRVERIDMMTNDLTQDIF